MVIIPKTLFISEETCYESQDLADIYRNHPNLFTRDDHVLSLFLMHEKLKKNESFFAPYLKILPQPNNLTSWTDQELEELQHSYLIDAVSIRRQHIETIYQMIFSELTRSYPDRFSYEKYTLQEFQFAWNIIQSRSFGRRLPWTALVPFADCLNHSNVATKYDLINSDGKELFRLYPSGSTTFAAGQPVFNSYGRKPNFYLMLDYGFALPDNEWDFIDIDLNRKQLVSKHTPAATLLLRQVGIFGKRLFRLTKSQGICHQLLSLERLLASSEEQKQHRVDTKHSLKWPDSLETERKAVESLKQRLEVFLSVEFTTRLEDDLVLPETPAVVYRCSLKRIILQHIQVLSLMLEWIEGRVESRNDLTFLKLDAKAQRTVETYRETLRQMDLRFRSSV